MWVILDIFPIQLFNFTPYFSWWLFLPWRYWSRWWDFPLARISCGFSYLFAVRRWGPRRPPLSHQKRTTKRYRGRGGGVEKTVRMFENALGMTHKYRVLLLCRTCGFCRNVCLWLAQPPLRFKRGSACLVQLPKWTISCQVLWMLITDVLMRRHTSASVKCLHQSVKDILHAKGRIEMKVKRGGGG